MNENKTKMHHMIVQGSPLNEAWFLFEYEVNDLGTPLDHTARLLGRLKYLDLVKTYEESRPLLLRTLLEKVFISASFGWTKYSIRDDHNSQIYKKEIWIEFYVHRIEDGISGAGTVVLHHIYTVDPIGLPACVGTPESGAQS